MKDNNLLKTAVTSAKKTGLEYVCMMKCLRDSSYCMMQESDAVLTMLPASVPRGVFGSCAISGSGGMGSGGGGGGGCSPNLLLFVYVVCKFC